MKIVVDANIFVSGYIWNGPPSRVIERIADKRAVLLISDEIVSEVEEAFNKPKLQREPQFVKSTMAQIKKIGKMVTVPPSLSVTDSGCGDPKDIRYLKCAVAGSADYIISGDNHLLKLGTYHGIKIITARDFLDFG